MNSYFFRRLFPFFLILFLSGCGYRVGNISGKEVQGVHTVFVPMIKNESYYPQLQPVITDEIIRRFNNDGTLETVNAPHADSELDVTIIQLRRTPLRSSQTNVLITAEFELTIDARVLFLNRRLGRPTVNNETITGRTTYYVGQDAVEGERQAIPLAAEDLANNIVKRITEGW